MEIILLLQLQSLLGGLLISTTHKQTRVGTIKASAHKEQQTLLLGHRFLFHRLPWVIFMMKTFLQDAKPKSGIPQSVIEIGFSELIFCE